MSLIAPSICRDQRTCGDVTGALGGPRDYTWYVSKTSTACACCIYDKKNDDRSVVATLSALIDRTERSLKGELHHGREGELLSLVVEKLIGAA